MLDKLKAIKSILYMEQEAQNSQAGSTNQKLHKSPWGKECSNGRGDVHELGKFLSYCTQLAPLCGDFTKNKGKPRGRVERLSGLLTS